MVLHSNSEVNKICTQTLGVATGGGESRLPRTNICVLSDYARGHYLLYFIYFDWSSFGMF